MGCKVVSISTALDSIVLNPSWGDAMQLPASKIDTPFNSAFNVK